MPAPFWVNLRCGSACGCACCGLTVHDRTPRRPMSVFFTAHVIIEHPSARWDGLCPPQSQRTRSIGFIRPLQTPSPGICPAYPALAFTSVRPRGNTRQAWTK